MELFLTTQQDTQIQVRCNGTLSHTFDPHLLLPGPENSPSHPLRQPKIYGQAIYRALFPEGNYAQQTLLETKEIIRLVLGDPVLETICWEYAYGPQGYLLLDYQFVRTLPSEHCIHPSAPAHHLHIIAVPSQPLEPSLPTLTIEAEWQQLKEIVHEVASPITLERTRPPTIEQLRRLTTHKPGCVVHFMGHGALRPSGSVLLFEQANGSTHEITAQHLQRILHDTIFIIVLNACVSATPGSDIFSNIAASLLQQHIPYVVGMRFAISDHDARLFSRTFYRELAQGTTVEEAVQQVRLVFAEVSPETIGIPILYTALTSAAPAFSAHEGTPSINDHQPHLDISALPRPEGTFHGYRRELHYLGNLLTALDCPRIVTLHGAGGIGKTALARTAVERFAHAWPGGVWAISLETLPSRELVVADLARLLALSLPKEYTSQELEKLVISHLSAQRTLLLLDNAETLIEAIAASDSEALRLASFLRETLPHPPVSLLLTSRSSLHWNNEIPIEVPGLLAEDGAQFLCQHLIRRSDQITPDHMRTLSEKLGGHPLSLRLLATAFDESTSSFEDFLQAYETQLLSIVHPYKEHDHRHRTLQACIAISAHHLTPDACTFLHMLTIFHAPFLAETAITILQSVLSPDSPERKQRSIEQNLQSLRQHGFLLQEEHHALRLYRLLPMIRFYAEQIMEQSTLPESLFSSFGIAYAHQTTKIVEGMDDDPTLVDFARLAFVDLERGMEYTRGEVQAYYWLEWGRITYRLGNYKQGEELTKQALEFARKQAPLFKLEGRALNNLADLYHKTGHAQKAFQYYEQALSVWKQHGSRSGEAWTYNEMALIYRAQGKLQQALALHKQVLPIRHEIGDHRGEAITLGNMAIIYQDMGQLQDALSLCEQSLHISRRVGDRNRESAALNTLALLAQQTGETERARKLHMQALHLKRAIGDRTGEAAVLNNLAEIYRITGQPQKRLRSLEQALSILQTLGDQAGRTVIFHNMATTYQSMGQLQKAQVLFEQILPLRREMADRKGEAATYNNLAMVHMERGATQRALKCWEQALSIHQEIGYRAAEGVALANIAGAHQQMGHTKQALFYYEQALPIIRETKNRESEAALLTSCACIFIERKDYQHAMEMLEQALLIQQEIGHKAGEIAVLNNIATIYQAKSQLEEALHWYERALTLQREGGNVSGEATTLNNMAHLYAEREHYQQSIDLYEHALSLQRTMGNKVKEALTQLNLARVYQQQGNKQKALDLFQLTLPMLRDQGDQRGEATARTQIAALYHHMGQIEQALHWYQQALPLLQTPDQQQEYANALTAMGTIYHVIGQLTQAQVYYEQALKIQQERHDPEEAATLLHHIALLNQSLGKMEEALHLHGQALEIYQACENRIGEANALNGMGEIFRLTRNFEPALSLFQQALSILHECHDHKEEAAVLNNMALVYRQTAQPLRALDIYTHIITIWHKAGDRLNEAHTFNNMGSAYGMTGQTQMALEYYQQALHIRLEVGHYAGASTTLCNMALLFYQQFHNQQEAILHLKQAIALLEEHHLPSNTAQQPLEGLQQLLETIQRGEPLEDEETKSPALSQEQLHDIASRTITVMIVSQEQQAAWREIIVRLLERAQQHQKALQSEAAFFTGLLALLDGQKPTMPMHNTYRPTLVLIETMLEEYPPEKLPFATDLIARSSTALTQGPQEKLTHLRSLLNDERQSTNKEHQQFLQCIALILIGADPLQLGQDLQGIYKLAWETLLIAVETADTDQHQLRVLRQSTLAVLGSETGKRTEWHHLLHQMRDQALAQGAQQLALLLQKLVELLESDGQALSPQQDLKGFYAQTWKEITLYLSLS